ncbi:MAG: hypothetical protein V3U02_10750 [Calditrichia bacterium]
MTNSYHCTKCSCKFKAKARNGWLALEVAIHYFEVHQTDVILLSDLELDKLSEYQYVQEEKH